MDITDVFKKCVKNERQHNPLLSNNNPKKLVRSEYFLEKVNHILKCISELNNLSYSYCCIQNTACDSFVTRLYTAFELEESSADYIINHCRNLLKELTSYIDKNFVLTSQLYMHQKQVVVVVGTYVNFVSKMRVKYKMLYLERNKRYCGMSLISAVSRKTRACGNKSSATENFSNRNLEYKCNKWESSESETFIPTHQIGNKANEDTVPLCDKEVTNNDNAVQLSTDELQLFDLENQELINDLNDVMLEVGQLRQKSSHLAELQEIFMKEILQQDVEIQRIDYSVHSTSQNVHDANLLLRKTIQESTSFRIYLLFVILVLSFSLLFLNWYNE